MKIAKLAIANAVCLVLFASLPAYAIAPAPAPEAGAGLLGLAAAGLALAGWRAIKTFGKRGHGGGKD